MSTCFAALLPVFSATLPCPKTHSALRAVWLDPSYDMLRRPMEAITAERGDWPTTEPAPAETVFVNLQVNKLAGVDAKAQTFTMQTWVRTIWWDPRLAFNASCRGVASPSGDGSFNFVGDLLEELWIPDFYSPSIAGSYVPKKKMVEQSAFWHYPDGMIWWTRELTWTIGCTMSFTNFPYDVQTCDFYWAPFRDGDGTLEIQVADEQDALWGLSGLRYGCGAELAEWTLLGANATNYKGATQSLGASRSQIMYSVQFAHNPRYYERYFLMPMAFMFVIAWSSFFIARGAVPARTAIVIISFLSISGMLNAVLSVLPKQSDSVWLLDVSIATMIFVFTTILEYVAANYLMRREAAIAKATEGAKKRLAEKQPTEVSSTARAAAAPDGPRNPTAIEVQVDVPPSASGFELLHEVRNTVGRAEACLLRRDRPQPTMYVRDQDLDVFCRYAYPLAYVITILALLAEVPAQPGVSAALSGACG